MSDFQKKRQEMLAAARAREAQMGRSSREAVGSAVSAVMSPVLEQPFGDEARVPSFGFDSGPGGYAYNYPETLNVAPALNTLAEEVTTPANYSIAGGLNMLRRGGQTVREALPNLNQARETAGSFLGAPLNYIKNYYAPTDIPQGATPSMFDRYVAKDPQAFADKVSRVPVVGPMVASKVRGAEDAEDVMRGRTSVQDFMNWGISGVDRGLFNIMSPEARALYASTGINPTTRNVAQAAVGGSSRDVSKALSQAQQNILTNTRIGRQGPVDPTLDLVDRISYISDTVDFTPTAYFDLIKQTGTRSGLRERDLMFFNEHIGDVWRAGDERFADAVSPKINIKSPTSKETGNHAFDFAQKGPVLTLSRLFTEGKKPSAQRLLSTMQDKGIRLHPKMGSNDEEILKFAKENGGFYITGSFTGNAITEGGVNYVAKVTPSGKIITVVSDENNFLENVPGVGRALEGAMSNRIVSATPPMVFDLTSDTPKKLISKATVPARKEVSSYSNLVERLGNVQADPRVLSGERMRTGGMLTAGAGGAGRLQQEEEERGR